MTLQPVLRSDELPTGEGGGGGSTRLRDQALAGTVSTPTIRSARVGDAEILLTRLATGEAVAFEAYCPHQNVSLAGASIFDGYLRCPQHYYLYDPRTGRNILPTQDASPEALCRLEPGCLETYPVEERNGWIWVDERPNPPPAAAHPADPAQRRAAPAPAPGTTAPAPEAAHCPTTTVETTAGAEFSLLLPTRLRPGHLWQLHVTGAEVAVLDQVFEDGESCAYRVRLAARDAGEATVRCVYAQPWSDQAQQTRTVTVRIAAAQGLT